MNPVTHVPCPSAVSDAKPATRCDVFGMESMPAGLLAFSAAAVSRSPLRPDVFRLAVCPDRQPEHFSGPTDAL